METVASTVVKESPLDVHLAASRLSKKQKMLKPNSKPSKSITAKS